jgi:hypothetical protein
MVYLSSCEHILEAFPLYLIVLERLYNFTEKLCVFRQEDPGYKTVMKLFGSLI